MLVGLGGDIAVAGQAPPGGWRIRVQDVTGRPEEIPAGPSAVVAITSGGLATSSTTARRWRRGGDLLHHILDPRTGLPPARSGGRSRSPPRRARTPTRPVPRASSAGTAPPAGWPGSACPPGWSA